MSDTTHEAPDDLVKLLRRPYGNPTFAEKKAIADRIEELEAKLAQQDDLVQAAVAAKLREAAGIARASFDGELGYDEILDLITSDAQAALDRVVAAELREAAECCNAQLHNTAMLMSNPPQSSAAWDARNAILALIHKGESDA